MSERLLTWVWPTYQWLHHWRKWHLPHVTVTSCQGGRFLSPSLVHDEMLLGPILCRSCQITIAALSSWVQEAWHIGSAGDNVLQHCILSSSPCIASNPHQWCSLSLRVGLYVVQVPGDQWKQTGSRQASITQAWKTNANYPRCLNTPASVVSRRKGFV